MTKDELITEFLTARLDEDEETASDASDILEWDAFDSENDGDPCTVGIKGAPIWIAEGLTWGGAAHIARHDPARVLADVAAKRAVIKAVCDALRTLNVEMGVMTTREELNAEDLAAEASLRALAAVYSDHPDYQPEWRL